MRIVGFNFTKISAERQQGAVKGLKINTEINVPEIKELKQDFLKTKEQILEVLFEYKVKYDPDYAVLDFKGRALLAVDPKAAKDILGQWKKKKISEDLKLFLFNIVIKKSSLKALSLEEELNLPTHIPLPTLRKQNKQ